jgi:hypothetical protein
MRSFPCTTLALALVLLAPCAAEPLTRQPRPSEPQELAAGTYKVAYGIGVPADAEKRLLAATATLDRNGKLLTLTLQDGTRTVLTFAPRPRDQWKNDCYTMNSYVPCEVADLAPGPLKLDALTFSTPRVTAKCSSSRMILADNDSEAGPLLVFDRQP